MLRLDAERASAPVTSSGTDAHRNTGSGAKVGIVGGGVYRSGRGLVVGKSPRRMNPVGRSPRSIANAIAGTNSSRSSRRAMIVSKALDKAPVSRNCDNVRCQRKAAGTMISQADVHVRRSAAKFGCQNHRVQQLLWPPNGDHRQVDCPGCVIEQNRREARQGRGTLRVLVEAAAVVIRHAADADPPG